MRQLIALVCAISMCTTIIANDTCTSKESQSVRGCSRPNSCGKDEHKKDKCNRKLINKVPYNIKSSGVYTLCRDLVFHPTVDGTNAITIDQGVTDVNIEFAGYTLSMDADSTTADNFGILINAQCENILIHGGTIHGFSASQIRGYDRLNTIEVRNMILKGIPEANGGQRMVNESFTSGVNFGPVVEFQRFEPDPTIVSNNIILKNLIINDIFLANLDIADQSAWGVALFACHDVEVDHVYVSNITNNSLTEFNNGGTLAFGFNLCTNCVSRFCTGNDITSFAPDFEGSVVGDAAGMNYIVCDRTENYDCSYNNCVGTRRSQGLVWVGSNDFVAERCVAAGSFVVDPTAPGVMSRFAFEVVGDFGPFAVCQRGVLRDCQVLNMPTAFIVEGSTDIIFEDCNAIAGNIVEVSTLLTEGFEANGADGVTFKNCIATGFAVPNPTTEGGFRIVAATNINIIGCKSTKNSIGILVEDGCTNVVADSNEVAFNTEFGIQDLTPVQTPNLYTRNVAFANPTNYSVNTANLNFAVVQTDQSMDFPLYTAPNASPLSNFDLQP